VTARDADPARAPLRDWALAAVVLAAAVVYLAWPLPRFLGTRIVDPPAGAWGRIDLDLLMWILAWDAHALATAPAHVFQANILYPARDVLAFSEHLLGLAPVAAPVFLATRNAILTYNVTILATVLVAALCTFAAVRSWTGSAGAALLAAVAFAFSPMLVHGWTRLHATAVHLFPLVLLLAWRAASAPRPRTLALLAVATAMQLLAGIYVAFELVACLAAFAPVVWWEARRHGRTGLAPLAAVAAGALVLVPVGVPYVHARAAGILHDYGGEPLAAEAFGQVVAHVATALTWPVAALAVIGLVAGGRAPRHLRLGLALVALVGILFCVGPEAPLVPGTDVPGPWALAARFVPGFSGVRGPIRFIVLPLLAGAALAGIGAGALAPRLGRAATAVLVAGALALVQARAPAGGLVTKPVSLRDPSMAAYPWLAAHGGGRPVLELPVFLSALETRELLATGRYMVGSTLHWAPLLNGYTGHVPPSYNLLATLARRLPDPDALATVCALVDVGWIVVHGGELGAAQRTAWQQAPPPLDLAWSDGDERVFRVTAPCGALEPALRAQLEHPDEGIRGTTLGGVPRAPLAPDARQGELVADLPAEAAAGLHGWLPVRVRNASSARWPGLSARPAGTVALQARWRDVAHDTVVLENEPMPVARDLGPGETITAEVGFRAPPPGTYVLEVGLVQRDVGWFVDQPGGRGVVRRTVRSRRWPRG
jgi:hypothetical protein